MQLPFSLSAALLGQKAPSLVMSGWTFVVSAAALTVDDSFIGVEEYMLMWFPMSAGLFWPLKLVFTF